MKLQMWIIYHDESDTFEVWTWDDEKREHWYDLESPHNKTYEDAFKEADRIMGENPDITWERKIDWDEKGI
jgi:hypothetical protein